MWLFRRQRISLFNFPENTVYNHWWSEGVEKSLNNFYAHNHDLVHEIAIYGAKILQVRLVLEKISTLWGHNIKYHLVKESPQIKHLDYRRWWHRGIHWEQSVKSEIIFRKFLHLLIFDANVHTNVYAFSDNYHHKKR